MKSTTILTILFLVLSCSNSKDEYVKWNGYLIPQENILSYQQLKLSFIETDQSSDIALVISVDNQFINELAFTLDKLENVDNNNYIASLNSAYQQLGTPDLKEHESGFLIFNRNESDISWQLVAGGNSIKDSLVITPVASCTTLILGTSCNFSIYTDHYYLAFSLSDGDIKFAKKIIDELKQQLQEWR